MPIPTQSNPSFALVDLSLEAVALCNEGANSRADIILTKRKESQTMPKTFEEIMKELQPEAADTINKHIDDVLAAKDADINTLQGSLNKMQSTVEALEKAKPAEQPATTEDILKSASPEVQKLFAGMQTQLSSLVDAQAEALAKERFEKCKAIPVDEATLKEVLKTASPAVVELLEKASAAVVEKTLTAQGVAADGAVKADADAHYAVLEKAARKIAADENITFEQGFTKACEADPKTYAEYVKGVR